MVINTTPSKPKIPGTSFKVKEPIKRVKIGPRLKIGNTVVNSSSFKAE